MTHKITIAALAAAIITTLTTLPAEAKITLPDIMSDNMVLQQSTTVHIWGTASPSETVTVTVSWSGTEYTVKSDKDGSWCADIETPTASYDAHTITIADKDGSTTLTNILIGEVWFCSGQSNMEMPLGGFWDCPVEHSAEIIAEAGRWSAIRVTTVPKTPALIPQEETPGKWEISSAQTASKFSATAYTFAQMLQTVLDVPVGIINCSWGGSSVEGWTSRETLASYPDIDVDAAFKDFTPPEHNWEWDYYLPMIMYNGMLYPLHNYTIKGYLWYQGCSNVGKHDTYPDRLKNMATEWRELWGQGDIPFYIVELAPYLYGGDGRQGARFRECQQKAATIIPNSGIITINDLVYPYETTQIHPCRKQEVGQRLAYLALNKTYGYTDLTCEGPRYKEMEINGDEVIISFYNDVNGFSPWTGITGFELAGEDKVFYPAEARVLTGQMKVAVKSADVPAPVAVRYCFKDFCPGNLTGDRNFPATPFRSDDWD